jgi:hypothetical protein
MDKATLKKGVDYAFNEMPSDSIDREEAQRQKKVILDKIEKGEITSPEEVMGAFDQLNSMKE